MYDSDPIVDDQVRSVAELSPAGTLIGAPLAASDMDATYAFDSSVFYDLDTFDGTASDVWLARGGVTPAVTSVSPWRGSGSLSLSGPYGTNFDGASGLEAGQTSAGFNTNTYPFMCMAYKLPAATLVSMIIKVGGATAYTLTMTQTQTPTTTRAGWWAELMRDNLWHYRCFNMDRQMDLLVSTAARSITSVYFDSAIASPAPSGSLVIDDFSISTIPEPQVYFTRSMNTAWASAMVWSLVSGGGGNFAVSSAGQISVVAASLPSWSAPTASYELTVQAQSGTKTARARVTVELFQAQATGVCARVSVFVWMPLLLFLMYSRHMCLFRAAAV